MPSRLEKTKLLDQTSKMTRSIQPRFSSSAAGSTQFKSNPRPASKADFITARLGEADCANPRLACSLSPQRSSANRFHQPTLSASVSASASTSASTLDRIVRFASACRSSPFLRRRTKQTDTGRGRTKQTCRREAQHTRGTSSSNTSSYRCSGIRRNSQRANRRMQIRLCDKR